MICDNGREGKRRWDLIGRENFVGLRGFDIKEIRKTQKNLRALGKCISAS
jgi:hypothetical protein